MHVCTATPKKIETCFQYGIDDSFPLISIFNIFSFWWILYIYIYTYILQNIWDISDI